MDLHQLYVFTKVVEHKSFSKAAEDIFLSQSTVSSHIQGLEKLLGVKLFDRVGRESILTPHGERLYHWALQLLLLKDQALLDLKQGMTTLRGMIRIAASSVPSQFMVPRMIKHFREPYPEVVFHINQSTSKHVAEKVLNGSVDLGILGQKFEDDKLRYIPLIKEKLVLVTSHDIRLTELVSINDILQYPFIMRNTGSGTNALLETILKKNHISKEQLHIVSYIEDGQSLIQLVIENVGISFISEIAAREYYQHNMLQMYNIQEFEDERYFYLVYNTNKTQSMISKLFIEAVKKWDNSNK